MSFVPSLHLRLSTFCSQMRSWKVEERALGSRRRAQSSGAGEGMGVRRDSELGEYPRRTLELEDQEMLLSGKLSP